MPRSADGRRKPMTFFCPWCLRAPKDFLYTDGENLQAMGPMLSVTPSGYYASYGYGRCERCGGEYIGLNLTMFDRDMDDDIAEYLYLNMDMRIITEETLEADGLIWELTV